MENTERTKFKGVISPVRKMREVEQDHFVSECHLEDLEAERETKAKAQKALDEEMLRAKALDDSDQTEKMREADANWRELRKLNLKVGKEKDTLHNLTHTREKVRKEALDSMRPEYLRTYAQAIKNFIEELKKLQVIELELRKMKFEGNRVASEVAPSGEVGVPKYPFLPCLRSLLIASEGSLPDKNLVTDFIDDCRARGLDVD